MDTKLAKVYYGARGYWEGIAAMKKLAEAAKVPEGTAKKWLIRQALWQIFLPAPRRIPQPKFDVPTPKQGPPGGPSYSSTRQATSWPESL